MRSTTPLWVWYLMRASGLVALLLLSASVALGVVGVARWRSVRWPRLVTAGLHRTLPLLAIAFLAVHVGTAAVDSFVGLHWVGVVLPFVSTYRPFWVGLGVLSGDLVLAVVATSLLRRHLGYRAWRAVHWGSWVLWPLALFHSLGSGSGTDARSPWDIAVTAVCLATVGAAAVWRLWLADEADGGGDGGGPLRVDPVPARPAAFPVPVPVPVEPAGSARRVTGGGGR